MAARDVAAFGVAALHNPAASRKTLQIGGPEALSWLETVAVASRVLRRDLAVHHFAPGDAEAIAGLPPQVGATLGGMLANVDAYDSLLDMKELARTYGVNLTSAETLLYQMYVGS